MAEPLNGAAILNFHDSVELFLALTAELLDAGGGPKTEFMEYFNLIAAKLPPSGLAHRDSMLLLNQSRVGLKHRGEEVSPRVVGRHRERVDLFFEDNCRRAYGVPLEDVSLAALVRSTKAGAALRAAELAWAEEDLARALEQLAVAFAIGLSDQAMSADTYAPPHFPFLHHSENDEIRDVAAGVQSLVYQVSELRTELVLLRNGIDTHRLEFFRNVTPHVAFTAGGTLAVGRRRG